MVETRFEFVLEVRREGAPVAIAPASAAACFEDALFRAVVAGVIPNDGTTPAFSVSPHWKSPDEAEATGLTLSHAGLPPLRYGRPVFAPQARALVRSLRAAKRLEETDPIEWRLLVERQESKPGAFPVRVGRAPFPLTPHELPLAPRGSLEVEFESAVLDAIQKTVAAAGAVERAGLLVGVLLHDPKRAAALLRVTGEVPLEAGSGGASEVHFALGPHSFLSARRAAAQRGDGAIPLGWWHSHPPCAACEDQPDCKASTVFFSEHDEEVHGAAFARPFLVALVCGKLGHLPASRPGFRLYGWQSACVEERAFRRVGAAGEFFRAPAHPLWAEV